MESKIEQIGREIGIKGNQFSQEEAKNFMETHTLTQTPREIGDLLTQWEASKLKKAGVFVPISKEEVFKDVQALKLLNTVEAKKSIDLIENVIKSYEKEEELPVNYFRDTQTGAVYTFPGKPEDVCAFVGYKLMYFKN